MRMWENKTKWDSGMVSVNDWLMVHVDLVGLLPCCISMTLTGISEALEFLLNALQNLLLIVKVYAIGLQSHSL